MSEVWAGVWAGLLGASALEQVATVLGVFGVGLMVRQNVGTFPVGLVQVTIFGWVCWQGQLYSEAVLQGVFFGALVYGWWYWTRGRSEAVPTLPVTMLSRRERWAWGVGVVVLWAMWGTVMERWAGADLAYADAGVLALSVASQWLQARKKLENWLGWVAANTLGVGVFWVKEWYWFALLYVVFWGMAVAGWVAWRRSMRTGAVGREGAV